MSSWSARADLHRHRPRVHAVRDVARRHREHAGASPLDFHEHFTYGTRIGKPDCPIPTHGLDWLPTRPPVALELLPVHYTPEAQYFTTVMSWTPRKPIVYDGVEYGQKDIEFWKIAELPTQVDASLKSPWAAGALREISAGGLAHADAAQVTRTTGLIAITLRSRAASSASPSIFM